MRLQCYLCGVVLVAVAAAAEAGGNCSRPVIFNFGDSNSDTGGYATALGWHPPVPKAGTFFRYATGRLCDGRLIIDFLCESVKARYLSPYLKALGAEYSNGVDFAISGATILDGDDIYFPLRVQLRQFSYFTRSSFQVSRNKGLEAPIGHEAYHTAVYTIDIGHNDLTKANLPYDQLLAKIPELIASLNKTIELLYGAGARKFWIHGTGALGCLPDVIRGSRRSDSDRDEHGCIKGLNGVAQAFNAQLSGLCEGLSSRLQDATVVYTDLFAIKYDLIANHTKYGFTSKATDSCTSYTASMPMCEDPSKFISWDGTHLTEAANRVVADKILSGDYSTPKMKFASLFDQVCQV